MKRAQQSPASQDADAVSELPPDSLLLPRLLIGLEALREAQQKKHFYPYPNTLRRAWDALSLRLLRAGKPAPANLTDLARLCAQPLGQWFPDTIPPELDSDSRLLYSGGGIVPTDTASWYLSEQVAESEIVSRLADAEHIERALQNQQFVLLRDKLKEAYENGNPNAQAEYVRLRRFLIKRPFTTRGEIFSAWASGICSSADVGALYQDCQQGEKHFSCPTCGPLFKERDRWRGAKPDVCSDHDGPDSPEPVPFEPNLCSLKAAIHERICLHGIGEVRLLDTMHELHQAHPTILVQVEDWPRIDAYDLRLTFHDKDRSQTIWAVDIKDYRSPLALARVLTPLRYDALEIAFDQGFYVFPDRRERNAPGYCLRARDHATALPASYNILTTSEFVRAVEDQIATLRRPRKKGSKTA